MNGNDWNMPEEGEKNLHTFKGKPFVITSTKFIKDSPYGTRMVHPNMGHFEKVKTEWIEGLDPESLEDMLKWQLHWRTGDIVKLIWDAQKETWKVVIKVLPKYENYHFPPYSSPTIYMNDDNEEDDHITDFIGVNLTGLEDRPAYTAEDAIQEGTCNGTTSVCISQFATNNSLLETSLKETTKDSINVIQ